MRRSYLATAASFGVLAAMAASEAQAQFMRPAPITAGQCSTLAGKTLGGALILEATEVAAGTNIATLAAPRGLRASAPFCRVVGQITPVEDSLINFEVWLPPAATWNGRFVGVGNGGTSGSIRHGEMKNHLDRNFAIASTDTGHISPGADSDWMFGHPEKIIDWAWRSHHLMTVASKQVINAFYGGPPKFSYFIGCSKGGTTSMMEAQRFPEDYDGIIAGAPGLHQSGQIAGYIWTHQAVTAPGAWMSKAKLELLRLAVVKACTGGGEYILNPMTCTFDPGRLQCRGADSDTCLTAPQVAMVRKVYSGPLGPDGKPFAAGFAYGSESAWEERIMGPEGKAGIGASMFEPVKGYMENLTYTRRNMDLSTIDAADVYKTLQEKWAQHIDAVNPDMSAFRARGGKLIQWIGWDDTSVRPHSSTNYYDSVLAKMGGAEQVGSFHRLFMAPGVEHCGGGPAPSSTGGGANRPASTQDARHDMFLALQDWVERGRAPDVIVATKYIDNDPAKGIAAQLPWCPYPAAPRYTRGDRKLVTSYGCETPRKR